MKTTKRILAVILAVLMTLGVFAISTSAAQVGGGSSINPCLHCRLAFLTSGELRGACITGYYYDAAAKTNIPIIDIQKTWVVFKELYDFHAKTQNNCTCDFCTYKGVLTAAEQKEVYDYIMGDGKVALPYYWQHTWPVAKLPQTMIVNNLNNLAAINRLDTSAVRLSTSLASSAIEVSIRDTDMAREAITLTQANVLQQASVSMLAQANQAPQGVLQLLR